MDAQAWRRLSIALCSLAALPAADFTTYIGDTAEYRVARVVADSAGSTYVAGSRAGGVFVLKLDTSGKIALFATLSGKGVDQANDLAVDSSGNFYVAGATNSTLLPLRNPLQAAPGPGFLVKLSADGTQILFSTYFPAPINALALDAANNIYVTGSTNNPAFPVTPGLPAGAVTPFTALPSVSGAFLTKIAAAGDRILYSALIAGHQKNCGAGSSCFLSSRTTGGAAIAVDGAGNAYIAGNTDTTDLPVTPGAWRAEGTGAFVAKVNPAGSALVYLTYLGAAYAPLSPFTNPQNTAAGIAADVAGNAYVAGATSDTAFLLAGATDAFVTKLNPQGTAAVWSRAIGGKDADTAHAIALDGAGSIWINGTTASADFPNAQAWSQGSDFIVELDAAGASLPFTSRFPNDTAAASLAIDPAGALHFAGVGGLVSTLSPAQKLAPRIFGIANAAYGAATGRVVRGEVFSIYGPHIGPGTPVAGIPDSAGYFPKSLGGVQVTVNGSPVPLLYAADSQINAVFPIFAGGPVRLRVSGNGIDTGEFTATLIDTGPEIFQHPDGSAAAVNQDGSINSPERPAKAGSIVSLWATGTGLPPITRSAQEGQVATVAEDFGCCQAQGPVPLRVTYGGAAPAMVFGVVQVNVELPLMPNALGEILTVWITAGGRNSHGVRIYVE